MLTPPAGLSFLDPSSTVGVLDAVSDTSRAALVLELPSGQVLAASAQACALLAPGGAAVVGRSYREFFSDPPSGAMDLLLAGLIDSYETSRTLPTGGGRQLLLKIWVRRIDDEVPSRTVLAVVSGSRDGGAAEAEPSHSVVGATGPDLLVDRISSDVTRVLGLTPDEAVGTSLLHLVDPDDVTSLLWALAEATRTGRGTTLHVRARRANGACLPAQLLLLPLAPPSSCAFVLHACAVSGPLSHGPSTDELLRRLSSVIDTAQATARVRRGLSDVAGLTGREVDVVERLLAGDRVPSIARALFLSPSTVRNHLSSVFHKLRVGSQQELLDLLRAREGSGLP